MSMALAGVALVLSAQGAAGFLLQASALGPAYAPRHALSTRAGALAAGRSHVCSPRPLLRGPPPLAQASEAQKPCLTLSCLAPLPVPVVDPLTLGPACGGARFEAERHADG